MYFKCFLLDSARRLRYLCIVIVYVRYHPGDGVDGLLTMKAFRSTAGGRLSRGQRRLGYVRVSLLPQFKSIRFTDVQDLAQTQIKNVRNLGHGIAKAVIVHDMTGYHVVNVCCLMSPFTFPVFNGAATVYFNAMINGQLAYVFPVHPE